MIAPRLGNAPISSASMGAWPASTIAFTEAACSARKSSRPALIGSTRASYFAVSVSASGRGTSPTCRTVVPTTNSLRLSEVITSSSRRRLLRSLVVPTTRLRQKCDDERWLLLVGSRIARARTRLAGSRERYLGHWLQMSAALIHAALKPKVGYFELFSS